MKKKYILLSIIILGGLSSFVLLQAYFTRTLPPIIKSTSKMIGGSEREYSGLVSQTSDGGFLLYSRTASSASGDVTDINPEVDASWVVKMDENYNIEWDTIVTDGYNTKVNDMIETKDGNYIGVGYRLRSKEKPDDYIFELNSAGEMQWQVTNNDYEEQHYNSIIETPTGFIIVGRDDKEDLYTHSGITITKVNSLGATQKELFLDGSGAEEALKVIALANGNYGVFANTSSTGGDFITNHGGNDILFYEIDDNLNIIKTKLFGSSGEERFSDAFVKSNGNILVTGYGGVTDGDVTVPIDSSGQSAWIFELNPDDLSLISQNSLPTMYSLAEDICNVGPYILVMVRDASSPYLYILDNDLQYVTKEKLNNSRSLYVNMDLLKNNALVFTTDITTADGIFSGISNGDSDIGYNVMSLNSPEIIVDTTHNNALNNPLTAEEIKTLYNVSAVDAAGADIAMADINVDSSTVDWTTTGTYTLTFSVTDKYHQTTSVTSQIVIENTITDITPPVITTSAEASIEAGTVTVDYLELFNVQATDNVDGNIKDQVVLDATNVELTKVGDYQVKFNVVDTSGNNATEVQSTLHVVDTTAPILTVDATQTVNVDDYILSYKHKFNATATDMVDGDLTKDIAVDISAVDLHTAGDYNITFTVQDKSGNKVTKSSILHVISNIKPTITTNPEAEVGLNATDINYINLFNVAVDDGMGNDVTEDVVIDSSSVNTAIAGDYEITFSYTSTEGVVADSKTSILHVKDMPPVLNMTPHVYVNQNTSVTNYKELFNVTAIDDKDGDISDAIVVDSSAVDLTKVGDYDVIFSIKDSSNQQVTSTATLTVQATEIDVMSKQAKNIAYACIDTSCDSASDTVKIANFESLLIEEQIIQIVDDSVSTTINPTIPSAEEHYTINGENIKQDTVTYQIDILNNGNQPLNKLTIGNSLNLNQITASHDLDTISIIEYNSFNIPTGDTKIITQNELYNGDTVTWDTELPAGNYLEFTLTVQLDPQLEQKFTEDEVFSSVVDVCFDSQGNYQSFETSYSGNMCVSDGADLNIDIDGDGVQYNDNNFTIQKFMVDTIEPYNSLAPGENLTIKIDIVNNNAAENNLTQTLLLTDELLDDNINYEEILTNSLTINNKMYPLIITDNVYLSSGDNLYETKYDGTNATVQNLLPQSNQKWFNVNAQSKWSTQTNNTIQGGVFLNLRPNEKYELEFSTSAKGQIRHKKLFNIKNFFRRDY
ncbi:MAG: immunoglobulin-like domain-containing protein [Mycoplasmatales bacterium]